MSERFYTIVNGAAGGGRCRSRADLVVSELRRHGLELDLHLTEGPGHATELARDALADGNRRFLSVGGDGTAFEVLNGLFPAPAGTTPVLGLLPLGTGNSFLRDFSVTDEEAAMQALRRGETRRCDVIRVEHRDGVLHYMNILSIGFTARAGDMTNRRFKRLGTGGYVLSVVANVATLSYPVNPIAIDGGEVDRRPAAFLAFSNTRYTGGAMMMAPEAHPQSGHIHVVRVGELPRGRFLAAFPKIFQGTHVDLPGVEQGKAQRVDFVEERDQPVMIDGEIRSLAIRSLEVLPGALEVIA
jgi:YegS/Rv2252/BmrU family lipid kinase